ncbi:MAG: HAMP domain-containing protein [Ignavibacteriales bacterium]|nr:HAMP domain-containing protein [Ignavibacteriales bacterium]
MREVSHTPPRIVWWALLSFLLLIALIGLGELGYTEYLTSRWTELRVEREIGLRDQIQRRFLEHVGSLRRVASVVARDSMLLTDLISNDPQQVLSGYHRLNRFANQTGFGLEIVDPNGTPVAWSGSGISTEIDPADNGDSSAFVNASGLRSFLSVSARSATAGLIAIASEAFNIHGAVSERFVPLESFRHALSNELGQDVLIVNAQDPPSSTDERRLRVPLLDDTGRRVATVLVDAPALESEILGVQSIVSAWMGLLASGAVTILGALLYLQVVVIRSVIVRLALLIGLLWLVRFSWLWMNVPSALVGGWIFDPAVYASLFGGGAASSLGELSISATTVLLTILLTRRELQRIPNLHMHSRFLNISVLLAAAFGLGLGLNIAVRAYGASLRSFVYDSTLKYVNPSEIIPSAPVILMHANILVLTVALILLFVAILNVMEALYRTIRPHARAVELLLVIGVLYTIAVVTFGAFDRVPQVPLYIPFALFAIALVVEPVVHKRGLGRPLVLSSIVVAAFVISVPVLDMKIHEKEGDRLRLYASELTQPVDAWLSFVTTESFRSVRESYREVVAADEQERANPGAFLLWTRTLMSGEGYNSALALYDGAGRELDRFAVGMTTYEQTELLHRLFDVDEDVLNVVERRVPGGLIKYYGLWGSIRDADDKPVAFGALILSASEQALFRGEAPVPLRPFGTAEIGLLNQSIVLTEYQDGRLAASSDMIRHTGPDLPEEVEELFASGNREVKLLEQINGRSFEILYVRDDSRPGRIIGISLEEVGFRWHLFNLVKVAILYAAVLGLAIGTILAADWNRYRTTLTGFRGRLIVAFLVVAIVPLFLFAYYNREFARERQELRMTGRLHEDLKLVSQRIVNTVSDEEDFLWGINDDFCEATGSEFGVDFSVFRRERILASSRPELYTSGLVEPRLPGDVFAKVVVAGIGYAQTSESIGDLTYEVGYVPLMLGGRQLGVVAVPALFRQNEFEAEVAERNAFTLAVYSILVLLTVIVGVILANQLSQPVRDLTKAAHAVGEGDLDVRVGREGSGELKELVRTFNEMVAELKKSREELRRGERERAWKEMAKQVAHEIKNPLTPMRLSIQHLRTAYRDKAPELDKLVEDVAHTLIDQIDALSRIATEFSSFARMPERRFERVDVHQMLLESLQLFSAMEGIEMRQRFADAKPMLVADREELRRVVINIIRNAVQAMNQRGTITVKTIVHGNRCTIEIADTGPGIPEDLQARVFEPNFSTKTDGMGLGLAMARNVIEDLNGTVTLRSTLGGGTTLILTLPTVPTNP